jgi:predicted GTPase
MPRSHRTRLLKLGWAVVLGLMVLPTVLLVVAGSWWLFEHRLLWPWLLLTGVFTLAAWWLAGRLRASGDALAADVVAPDEVWTPSDRQAWEKIEALARRVQDEDLPLDRPEPMLDLLREVLGTAARHYHPKSRQPELETPVPYALRIAELVAGDLRQAFSENVPGAHILTLRDLFRLRHLPALYRQVYFVYRVFHFGFNPLGALLRELRDAASGEITSTSTTELQRFAVGFCVRKAGSYAIQLYSGRLVLDGMALADFQSRRSKRDAGRDRDRTRRLAEEPLRILVLGQVKSGKSSLVNALFGELRAAVDVVPRTKGVEPYVLEREGVPRAIILDTAGYEAAGGPSEAFESLRGEILGSDLLLMVCSAQSAARQPDRSLLDRLRALFDEQPDRMMPLLVVAVTHVDQVRPLAEWEPPYDIVHPATAKARQIREAIDAVRQDLDIGDQQAVVPVCLKPGQLYNVEEGLAPAILQAAPEAQRVKYLRCLRQFHQEDAWKRLWQQAVGSGRILLQAGAAWIDRARGADREIDI